MNKKTMEILNDKPTHKKRDEENIQKSVFYKS